MITIGFLADHLDTIPTLTKWFRDQWSDYYEDLSPAEMEQDFLEDVSRNSLPSRLVAFEDNALAGTIVLRENGGTMPPEFRPELGGLYVVESHRRRGIATELVRAGMKLALDQGYETVFATTVSAAGILEHLGWEFIKTVVHSDGSFLCITANYIIQHETNTLYYRFPMPQAKAPSQTISCPLAFPLNCQLWNHHGLFEQPISCH